MSTPRSSPSVLGTVGVLLAPLSAGAQTPGVAPNLSYWAVGGVAVFVLLMLAATFAILLVLQRRFLKVCEESDNLALYAEVPFGVPRGTIRSMLAMSIVFASLLYMALTLIPGLSIEFPQVIAGILGTVLGFYFGSRSGAGQVSTDVLQQIGTSDRGREAMVAEAEESQLSVLVQKARVGVSAAKALARVLPADMASKVGTVVDKVDRGLAAAAQLAGAGNVGKALSQARKAVDTLEVADPLREVLGRAVGSFGRVVGVAVPPVAIAGVIVAVGSRLAGVAYDRWVARVLNAPYTPELFPPSVIDGAVAMSVIRSAPRFRQAFKAEIERGDLAFVVELVRGALREDADMVLWERDDVASRFQDQEAFDQALSELQRAAMGVEVSKDLDPAVVAPAGGLDRLLRAMDQINGDPEAQADLDALVLAVDELKRQGEVPEPVFKAALEGLEGGSRT